MDYFKVPYTAYVILIICVVIISFLKLLLSNKLILHTLHKKNYGGNFSIIKASLISLLTEVLVILIPLAFFTLIIMSINHSSVDIVAFLDEFYEMVVGFVFIPPAEKLAERGQIRAGTVIQGIVEVKKDGFFFHGRSLFVFSLV